MTVAEGVCADGGHAFGKDNTFEGITGIKKMIRDGREPAGKDSLFQSFARPEYTFGEPCRIRQDDFFQNFACVKRSFADLTRPVRDTD